MNIKNNTFYHNTKDTEAAAYRGLLEFIAQDVAMFLNSQFADDDLKVRMLEAELLKIQLMAENALRLWTPKYAEAPPDDRSD